MEHGHVTGCCASACGCVADNAKMILRKITEPANPSTTDNYKLMEQDPEAITLASQAARQRRRTWEKALTYILAEQTWLFLGILGITVAVIVVVMDNIIVELIEFREKLVQSYTQNILLQFLIYTGYSLFFTILAALVVRFVSPQSSGSGIPEMKSVFTGVLMPRYLNFRTMLAKIVALTFAVLGGLSIGREGPSIHISALVANQLSRIPIFARIGCNAAIKSQMILTGCAVGVSSVFGAPVGGVLFAIETTTTYYLLQNLWKAFFSSVSGAMVVKILGEQSFTSMFETHLPPHAYTTYEMVPFAIIGILFGWCGSIFVKLLLKIALLRRNTKILSSTRSRYIQLLVVAFITCVATFPFKEVRTGDKAIMNDLFLPKTFGYYASVNQSTILDPVTPHGDWVSFGGVFVTLFAYLIPKYFLTAVSLGLPIPCGLYAPSFLIGAVGGRICGELMAVLFGDKICPGGYAVVGAAAFAAGVTRTVSAAIIVFEITGELEYLLPVLLAVLLANGVGNIFSRSAYDALLEQKRLPYMPQFGNVRVEEDEKYAKNIMDTNIFFVSRDHTYLDLQNLLDHSQMRSYPLVDSQEHMLLQGAIPRTTLQRMIDNRDLQFQHDVETYILKNVYKSSDRNESVQFLKQAYKKENNEADTFDSGSSFQINELWANDEEEVADAEGESSVEPLDMEIEQLLEIRRQSFYKKSIADELSTYKDEIDPSAFQMPDEMSFYKIHYLFAMLGLSHAFVTKNGRLIGVITKKDFLQREAARTKI